MRRFCSGASPTNAARSQVIICLLSTVTVCILCADSAKFIFLTIVCVLACPPLADRSSMVSMPGLGALVHTALIISAYSISVIEVLVEEALTTTDLIPSIAFCKTLLDSSLVIYLIRGCHDHLQVILAIAGSIIVEIDTPVALIAVGLDRLSS